MGLTDEGISTREQARGSLTCQPGASGAGHLSGDGFSGHVHMEEPPPPGARPADRSCGLGIHLSHKCLSQGCRRAAR